MQYSKTNSPPSSTVAITRPVIAALAGVLMMFMGGSVVAQDTAQNVRPLLIPPGEHMVTNSEAYSRYSRPSQCEPTVRRAIQFFWRDKRPDTVSQLRLKRDTLPTAVQQVAKACLQALDVEKLPITEVPELSNLYASLGMHEYLTGVESRIAAADPAIQPGLWARYTLGLTAAYPADVKRAEGLVDRMVSLGELGAYHAFGLLHNIGSSYMYREQLEDVLRTFTKATQIYVRMSKDDQINEIFELSRAYDMMFEAAYWLEMRDSAAALVTQAEKVLLPQRPAGTMHHSMLQRGIDVMRQRLDQPLAAAAPLLSDWRFDAAGENTAYPRHGVSTLVVFVDANARSSSFVLYNSLKELQRQYGGKGLEIVAVSGTSGWFRDRTVPDAESEVQAIRHYLKEYVGLPGPLLVTLRERSRRFDGRLMPEPDPNATAYTNAVNLVGRDGKIILGESMVYGISARMHRLIRKELGEGPSLGKVE